MLHHAREVKTFNPVIYSTPWTDCCADAVLVTAGDGEAVVVSFLEKKVLGCVFFMIEG